MRRVGYVARMGGKISEYGLLVGNLKERNHKENLHADWRIIRVLKWL
jgi:hypothetical protein